MCLQLTRIYPVVEFQYCIMSGCTAMNDFMYLMTKPFGSRFVKWSENSSDILSNSMLDAVYIPTLANKCAPVSNIYTLLKYANEIVLIYSNEEAVWSKQYSNHIRVELINDHKDFCINYHSKEENQNISVRWRPSFDIPLKRSFALFDAKKRSYKKILLLDDDIFISEKNIGCGILGLLEGSSIVGFHVVDFPDVSTIDHIERIVNKKNNIISMTGSCMFLNIDFIQGDFLDIYNEDLFFFLSQPKPDKVVSGGIIYQKPYAPWTNLSRIRHEQFGDLIYDAFKKRFLGFNCSLIDWNEEIRSRIEKIKLMYSQTEDKDILCALDTAISAIQEISIHDIEHFLEHGKFAPWAIKYARLETH